MVHRRNRLLISIGVAVLLVAALCTTAFAVELTGPETVTPGSEIQIKVTGTMKGLSANIQTTGLQFVNVDGGLSDEETLILLEDFGGMTGIYTYNVTAQEGETVSFVMTQVTESDGERDIPANNMTWTGTVGGAFGTETSEPTPTVNTPVQPPVAQVSQQAPAAVSNAGAAVSPVTSAAATASATAQATPGPETADDSMNIWLLCIGAAACAIVAVVVGRKMFKRAH